MGHPQGRELSSCSVRQSAINTADRYQHLRYGQQELAHVMRKTYDDLIAFVTTREFKSIMDELSEVGSQERPAFVLSVLLDKEELSRRGVHVPEGILIQRSAFGDRRPTLFCVKKYLPKEYSDVWQNVNLTFDERFSDDSVSRAPEIAWRPPLPVHFQAQAMANGESLENVQIPLEGPS
jgi:hypothetical protein